MKGHIKITDKVYFVYSDKGNPKGKLLSEFFGLDTKKYEASKKTIEVSNVTIIKCLYFFYSGNKIIMHPDYELKNGSPYEAEVTDKALITKLL